MRESVNSSQYRLGSDSDDTLSIQRAIEYQDSHGGGTVIIPPSLHNVSQFELTCGVDIIGFGAVLRFTEPNGDGIFCSIDATRQGQFSRIWGITFGRSGSYGGRAIYTEDDNSPFFTQSPHWDIQWCTFRDLDASYTLPPSPNLLGAYGWECVFDCAQANGVNFAHNDVFGVFNPTLAASGQIASVGVRFGTAGTAGAIANRVQHNRLWYLHTPVAIGLDSLAVWIEQNEMIKCYRGVYAPDSGTKDADIRVKNNFITTCIGGIDLVNRQLFQIESNHTNGDPGYYDNGLGFTGIRLTNCAKGHVNGNSSNLGAGHAGWAGTKQAVLVTDSESISVIGHQVSRYHDDGVTFAGNTDGCISIGHRFTQLSGYGHRVIDSARNITIGETIYVNAEPVFGRFDITTSNQETILIDGKIIVSEVIFIDKDSSSSKRYSIFVNTSDSLVIRDVTRGADILSGLSSGNAWNFGMSLRPMTTHNLTLGSATNIWNRAYTDALALTDGTSAPAAATGTAFLYVDSIDGDLKVKFGDGTIKTISTDT